MKAALDVIGNPIVALFITVVVAVFSQPIMLTIQPVEVR